MKTIQRTSPGPERGRLRHAAAGRRGVTLIEVVAALGVMAVGIVGLLTLFPLGLDATARAGDRTTAAILGEYVIEQVRLCQDEITTTDNTTQALHALEWDDYTYPSSPASKRKDLTFELHDPDKPHELPGSIDGYGSGEQIMKQTSPPHNDLTDRELFSRYEVALRFDEIEDNDAFTAAGHKALMQVTITVRWPRAFDDDSRKNQETMTFVTYIRPRP